MKLSRDEYLEIIRMIFHNFSYDDFKDKLFIHDYEVMALLEPGPISFFLDFVDITIYPMCSKTKLPYAAVTLKQMRLKWLRDKKYNVILDLYAKEITISYFEPSNNPDELVEKGITGDIQLKQIIKLKGAKQNFQIDSGIY